MALMAIDKAIETAVVALQYELVDVERSAGGLLRVTIDRIPGHPYANGEGEFVTVEDCEAVTRQLRYVLETENADYRRLEVSSPGLDRPLKREHDYQRFAGQEVVITLKQVLSGRKNYRGVLREHGAGWQLELTQDKPGQGERTLDFTLDEVREARLVPVIDFKGRKAGSAGAGKPAAGQEVDGGQAR